jgi:hypothetical protein
VRVTLYWRCLTEVEERYKVFVHLVGPAGLVAQSDAEPAGNARPLTSWVRDEVIADTHEIVLPAALPPGEYTLQVGLYDLRDGRRLPLLDPTGREIGNHLALPW